MVLHFAGMKSVYFIKMKYLEDFYEYKNDWRSERSIEEKISRLENIVEMLIELVGGKELEKYTDNEYRKIEKMVSLKKELNRKIVVPKIYESGLPNAK